VLANQIDKETSFACISDQKYLKYLKSFLKSLSIHQTDIHVQICLINIKNKQKISLNLVKIYNNISVEFYDQNFTKTYEKKAFCANHRAEFISKLLNDRFQNIIYVDVDSLVRKKVSADLFFNNKFDIKIHFREGNDKRMKVAAGVIAVRKSDKTQNFFNEWRALLEKSKYEWFADQVTFYKLFLKYEKILSFDHLPANLIDWNFNSESYIWAGKGNRKYKDKRYWLETQKNNFLFLKNRIFNQVKCISLK